MECVIKKARTNLAKLIKFQNTKVTKYFVTGNDKLCEKLLILAADINGLVEQIDVLNFFISSPDSDRVIFVSDNSDLDICDTDLQVLYETKCIDYFLIKYNANVLLKDFPVLYNYFLKQNELFIDNITRLNEIKHSSNIEELMIIKSIAIKHLCTLEFLINKK
ncbi:PKIP-1 [Parapoynx stagnalis nucleopolyhedrovirus]|uniref:PKIP-1 n=1 Tax=Parapoynx stagnalis nucleopolyhedrovirus TaxID=2993413 RepID=A0A9E7YJ75_9ABAC|nr:PKIP-1 [Parapoynx stagnalis nucleopolyhedrovirus]